MEIPVKLAKFLKRNKLYYQVMVHPQTFTSLGTAEAGHVSGKAMVKVVLVKADEKDVMVILPSSRTLDLFKLSSALKTNNVRVEEEKEFKDLFPDCELGAMPPFGRLYHLSCYVDESVKKNDKIYFNAGNHEECIQVWTDDFLRVAKGKIGDFSVPGKKITGTEKIAVS